MKRIWAAVAITIGLSGLVLLAQGQRGGGGDPPNAIHWSASQLKQQDTQLSGRVDPERHMAAAAFIPSANGIYRTGNSQAEVHEKQGDFIFVRDGEGTILVGGKLIGGKPERADELRGDSIEGGTSYKVTTGDQLYIPVNVPHQFLVENGKHLAITIVKLNPQR